jgi:hypothetical protein
VSFDQRSAANFSCVGMCIQTRNYQVLRASLCRVSRPLNPTHGRPLPLLPPLIFPSNSTTRFPGMRRTYHRAAYIRDPSLSGVNPNLNSPAKDPGYRHLPIGRYPGQRVEGAIEKLQTVQRANTRRSAPSVRTRATKPDRNIVRATLRLTSPARPMRGTPSVPAAPTVGASPMSGKYFTARESPAGSVAWRMRRGPRAAHRRGSAPAPAAAGRDRRCRRR